jgi:hypothetical protein
MGSEDHSTVAHDGEHGSNQFGVSPIKSFEDRLRAQLIINYHWKRICADTQERKTRVMTRYSISLVLFFGLTILISVQPGFSQTAEEFTALKKEIGALKAGQAGLKKDIQDLKKLAKPKLAAAPAAKIKDAIINIKGAPIKGDKNA